MGRAKGTPCRTVTKARARGSEPFPPAKHNVAMLARCTEQLREHRLVTHHVKLRIQVWREPYLENQLCDEHHLWISIGSERANRQASLGYELTCTARIWSCEAPPHASMAPITPAHRNCLASQWPNCTTTHTWPTAPSDRHDLVVERIVRLVPTGWGVCIPLTPTAGPWPATCATCRKVHRTVGF
jgi:hypothetical protein